MFGVKVKSLQTRNRYTVEELFDAIKTVKFTAGTPQLTHAGLTPVIVFPALDVENQVRIYNASMVRNSSNRFFVQRDERVGSISSTATADDAEAALASLGASPGNRAKACEMLVDRTYEELDELRL